MAKVKISELPALTPATLDTTFVVGISGSTTYKISINQLTSSLDTTFATDLVVNAVSGTINTLATTASFNALSTSVDSRLDSLENATSSYLTSLNGALSSSAQVLNGSGIYSSSAQLPTGLLSSSLGFVATSSYSTDSASFNSRIISGSSVAGTISGSSQLTSSFDTRYAISASFVSSSNLSSIQTITSASYAALTPVSGTLYIIIG